MSSHTITVPQESGDEKEILGRQQCPGCRSKDLRWKNTGQQAGKVVIRAECSKCQADIEFVIPGKVLNPMTGEIG